MTEQTPDTERLRLPEGFVKRRGRPKGLGKVPGSGRRRGTPNRTTAETREMILQRADPIGFLCDVVRGLVFEAAPEPGSTKRVRQRPTINERIRAATVLARKMLPDIRLGEVSIDDGKIIIALPISKRGGHETP